MQPKLLELCILNQISRILLEEDDDHTSDVAVVVVDDDDEDDDDGDGNADDADDVDDDNDDDNATVELFQKRGKCGSWSYFYYSRKIDMGPPLTEEDRKLDRGGYNPGYTHLYGSNFIGTIILEEL